MDYPSLYPMETQIPELPHQHQRPLADESDQMEYRKGKCLSDLPCREKLPLPVLEFPDLDYQGQDFQKVSGQYHRQDQERQPELCLV